MFLYPNKSHFYPKYLNIMLLAVFKEIITGLLHMIKHHNVVVCMFVNSFLSPVKHL